MNCSDRSKTLARNETGLTDKQQRFCEEFLKDFHATAAYLRAGYECGTKAAESGSARLLRNAKIQAYLSKKRSQVAQATQVTLERTVQEIGRVAFSNITAMLSFDSKGVQFKDSASLPEDVTAAIAQVKSVENTRYFGEGDSETRIEFSGKMHNKVSALTLLADFFGIRDDFNKARASLRRYGLELAEDIESDLGWRLERYDPSATGSSSAIEADEAAEEFFAEDE